MIFARAELEAREARELAAYAMPSGATRGRVHEEPESAHGTPFQRDRERVVRSRAFRRLQYKTQVFVNHEGDYYRTRLTHSLEAAQIARVVARALCLNEDLAETISLAHDIGHPPFGHAGERALRALMGEHGGFEHNAQALRLVDLLERRHTGFRGLNLTYEVREGIWKRRDTETSRALGYAETFAQDVGPLLEAQVADCVDSIAYDHHDLDDALKAGLIQRSDLRGIAAVDEAEEAVLELFKTTGKDADTAERVHRQELIRYLRRQQIQDLIEETQRRLDSGSISSLSEVRGASAALVGLSEPVQRNKVALQSLLHERVYRHWRVKRAVEKGQRLLERLFVEFIAKPHLLPEEYQEWVKRAGAHRGVCDYIAGMTDRYAQREHRQLFGLFEKM
ncbi:MAG: deoxyguanosinetriphosphate triphosphohydrolase [Planctomycetes bacterium]|nr:deoxyguanosinetriphosphate triphosphohydrolase [Planctomycetota bacterium]